MSIALGNQIKELAAMVLDLQARIAVLEAGPHAEVQQELQQHTEPEPDPDPPRQRRTYTRKAQPA